MLKQVVAAIPSRQFFVMLELRLGFPSPTTDLFGFADIADEKSVVLFWPDSATLALPGGLPVGVAVSSLLRDWLCAAFGSLGGRKRHTLDLGFLERDGMYPDGVFRAHFLTEYDSPRQ